MGTVAAKRRCTADRHLGSRFHARTSTAGRSRPLPPLASLASASPNPGGGCEPFARPQDWGRAARAPGISPAVTLRLRRSGREGARSGRGGRARAGRGRARAGRGRARAGWGRAPAGWGRAQPGWTLRPLLLRGGGITTAWGRVWRWTVEGNSRNPTAPGARGVATADPGAWHEARRREPAHAGRGAPSQTRPPVRPRAESLPVAGKPSSPGKLRDHWPSPTRTRAPSRAVAAPEARWRRGPAPPPVRCRRSDVGDASRPMAR